MNETYLYWRVRGESIVLGVEGGGIMVKGGGGDGLRVIIFCK